MKIEAFVEDIVKLQKEEDNEIRAIAIELYTIMDLVSNLPEDLAIKKLIKIIKRIKSL